MFNICLIYKSDNFSLQCQTNIDGAINIKVINTIITPDRIAARTTAIVGTNNIKINSFNITTNKSIKKSFI